MNLVNTTEEVEEHARVLKLEFNTIKPFIKRVERKYIIPHIGTETYAELLKDDVLDTDQKNTKALLQEAIVNLSFYIGFAQLTTNFTDYSLSFIETDNTKPVDWATKRDLQKTYFDTGFDALDEALKMMEHYVDKFPYWRDSESYTVFNEHFTKRTDEFQRHFNIGNSRKTFIALKPIMREVEEQYFLPMLGKKTITHIATKTANPIISRALDLCQKAEIAFSISKSVTTGSYLFDGESAKYIWERLPWEKETIPNTETLTTLSKNKHAAGKAYLIKLQTFIENNLEYFPDYIPKEKTNTSKTFLLKSGLAI